VAIDSWEFSKLRNSHLVGAVALIMAAAPALLATGFAPAPAAAASLAALLTAALILRNRGGELLRAPVEGPWLAQCLAFAALISMLGGQGHFFFSKDDWLYRDAVLADITRGWLPVVYGAAEERWLLRAPLGMYLLPGAVGRFFGLTAAHVALAIQNSFILGVIFYAATLVWPRRRHLFLALFVLFSGLDAIPVLVKTGGGSLLVNLAFWVDHWQYSSNVSAYFWSPNHVLPGWWFALLCVLRLRDEIDLAALAAAGPPLMLWSPLTLLGGAALFVLLACRAPRGLLSLRFAGACCAALGMAPVIAYLGADAGAVPHRWLLFETDFVDQHLIFILFALPQAGFLALFWRRVAPWLRVTLFASIALLLAIPAYSVGFMNDFSQRAPIVPRAILAFGFDALLIDLLASGAFFALASGIAMVLVGAITPALELYDTVTARRFTASDCNLPTVHMKLHPRDFLSTYLARPGAMPHWLMRESGSRAPLVAEDRLCWPDRLYGEKLFDWLKPENRIWLRRPAAKDDR